jgi:hypothetical protein
MQVMLRSALSATRTQTYHSYSLVFAYKNVQLQGFITLSRSSAMRVTRLVFSVQLRAQHALNAELKIISILILRLAAA